MKKLYVYNAPLPSLGGGSSSWRKAVQAASDTIIKAGSYGKNQISILNSIVCVGRSVHSKHMQREGMVFVKSTKALESSGDRNICFLSKILELRHCVSPNDALAGVYHWSLGFVYHLHHLWRRAFPFLCVTRFAYHRITRSQNSLAKQLRVTFRDGTPEDIGGYILWQIDQDWAWTPRRCDVKCLSDNSWQILDFMNHRIPFRAGSRDPNHISLLERIRANRRCRHLPGEDHHRSPIHQCILHWGDGVGSPGSAGDKDNTRLARGACISFSHMPCPLLVPWEHKIEVFAVVNAIKYG
mmetsp:Transcript_16553/g.19900  ORF Transcript_16553/g.19900 Transcript_16553/m.19900 type:complete len:297 (-) Transcript_16553:360-1250(-)